MVLSQDTCDNLERQDRCLLSRHPGSGDPCFVLSVVVAFVRVHSSSLPHSVHITYGDDRHPPIHRWTHFPPQPIGRITAGPRESIHYIRAQAFALPSWSEGNPNRCYHITHTHDTSPGHRDRITVGYGNDTRPCLRITKLKSLVSCAPGGNAVSGPAQCQLMAVGSMGVFEGVASGAVGFCGS